MWRTALAGRCPLSSFLAAQDFAGREGEGTFSLTRGNYLWYKNFWVGSSGSWDDCQLSTGGVAQLGEHLAGSQKVTGSSPVTSTIYPEVFATGSGERADQVTRI